MADSVAVPPAQEQSRLPSQVPGVPAHSFARLSRYTPTAAVCLRNYDDFLNHPYARYSWHVLRVRVPRSSLLADLPDDMAMNRKISHAFVLSSKLALTRGPSGFLVQPEDAASLALLQRYINESIQSVRHYGHTPRFNTRCAMIILSARRQVCADPTSVRLELAVCVRVAADLWRTAALQNIMDVGSQLSQRRVFQQRMTEHYRSAIVEVNALVPLASFLLPHQVVAASMVVAKEQLRVYPYEMLHHLRMRCSRKRLALDAISAMDYEMLTLPIDAAREHWMVCRRPATVLNDAVGMGKTLSALAAVMMNGVRADNPFDLDVPPRGALFWTRYVDMDEDTTSLTLNPRLVSSMPADLMPRLASPHLPGSHAHSHNAQGGGTLIMVPCNMVDHWQREIERIQELVGAPGRWRVGIVGRGPLATSRRISPERMAGEYDIVILPHTLMTAVPRALEPAAVQFLEGFHWPEPRAPYLTYVARVDVEDAAARECMLPRYPVWGLVLCMTAAFLESHLIEEEEAAEANLPPSLRSEANLPQTPAGGSLPSEPVIPQPPESSFAAPGSPPAEASADGAAAAVAADLRLQLEPYMTPEAMRPRSIWISPADLVSPHMALMLPVNYPRMERPSEVPPILPLRVSTVSPSSIPSLPPEAFGESGRLRLRITHTGVFCGGSAACEPRLSNQYSVHYTAGIHAEPLSVPIPPQKAVVRVRWARAIADELHLLVSPGTIRSKVLTAVEADNFLGMTAEVWSTPNLRRSEAWCAMSNQPFNLNRFASSVVARLAFLATDAPRPCRIEIRPPILVPQPEAVSRAEAHVWSSMQRARRGVLGMTLVVSDASILSATLRASMRQLSFGAAEASVIHRLHILAQMAEAIAARAVDRHIQQEMHHRMPVPDATARRSSAPAAPTMVTSGTLALSDVAGSVTLTCPICLEEDDRAAPLTSWLAVLPCKHPICEECYDDMVEQQMLARTCALCRSRIQSLIRVRVEAVDSRVPTAEAEVRAAEAEVRAAEAEVRAAEAEVQAAEAAEAAGAAQAAEAAQAAGSAEAAGAAGAAEAAGAAQAAAPMSLDSSAKFQRLTQLLDQLVAHHPGAEQGSTPSGTPSPSPMHGAVIFCDCRDEHMEQMHRALQERLGQRGSMHCILSRHTNVQRGRTMNAIMSAPDGVPQILLVRYRICAVGVNYIFADNVIFYTTPHRADYVHQAAGRLCRIGQRRHIVNVWTIAYEDSFEALIWRNWIAMADPSMDTARRLAPSLQVLMQRYWASRVQ